MRAKSKDRTSMRKRADGTNALVEAAISGLCALHDDVQTSGCASDKCSCRGAKKRDSQVRIPHRLVFSLMVIETLNRAFSIDFGGTNERREPDQTCERSYGSLAGSCCVIHAPGN
jgi:hypothetical protein